MEIPGPISFAMMAEVNDTDQFSITAAGKLALGTIDFPKQGHIAALFERSFYAQINDNWICFGSSSLSMGPLNIRTDTPTSINWQASGLRLDDPVKNSATQIHIGNLFAFSYRDAKPWQPDPVTKLNKHTIIAGLATLTDQALSMAPTEGLASFIFPEGSLKTALPMAAPAVGAMRNFVQSHENNPSNILEPVTTLVGMGPGLTPSGDDFLGGMMITLCLLGEGGLCGCLANAVEMGASDTNDISRAHLKAAAQGIGAEPLHAVINDVISNRPQELTASLKRLDVIGHCSGWDALTGVVITLRAWLAR
ncbi:MAG: DUF2877 domain-containing protein [Alphaproteobacteria bacterium]|nr:DUF2877 domain-containing protein [Alphaproteobacteria bacterium]